MKKTDSSGEIQISSQASVAKAKVLGNDINYNRSEESDIIDVTYEDVTSTEIGKLYRKKITRKYVPRRTYLKGYLKGKYRGELETGEQFKKDVGTYFDISIYESQIFSNWEEIITNRNILFSDFEACIIQNCKVTKIIEINKSQLQNNVLVLGSSSDPSKFKIDLFEPRIFNVKLIRELHQTAGEEVFGVIEADVFGYLLDKIEVVEEIIEEVSIPSTNKKVDKFPEIIAFQTAKEPGTNTPKIKWFDKFIKTTLGCFPFVFSFLGILTLFLFTGGLPGLIIIGVLFFLAYIFKWRGSKISWIFSLLFFGLLASMFFSFFNNKSSFDNIIGKIVTSEIGRQVASIGKSNPAEGEKKSNKIIPNKSNLAASNGKEASSARSENKVTKTNSVITQQSTEKPLDKLAYQEKPHSENFQNFLNIGLKAVEDEEYTVANSNFKKAATLEPQNPRLQQLAAEFIKIGNEKCEGFKIAKVNNLKYIPNNYYQYAASLTNNKPLLCD